MTSKNPKKDKVRASWAKTYSFITICVDVREREGFTSDGSGFKGKSWTTIHGKFCRENRVDYDNSTLSSKYSDLKTKFKVFEKLKGNAGFGWDERLKLPTAPDDVWTRYLEQNPDAKAYRTSTLPHYYELAKLFSGKYATGKFLSAISATSSSHESSTIVKVPVTEDSEKSDSSDDDMSSVTSRRSAPKGQKPQRKRKGKFDDVVQVLNSIRADNANARKNEDDKLTVVQKAMSELDKLVDSPEFEETISGPEMYAMKRKFMNQLEAEFFLGLKVKDMKEWIRNNK